MKIMSSAVFGICLIEISFLETVKLSEAMDGLLSCNFYNLTNCACFFHRFLISKIFGRYISIFIKNILDSICEMSGDRRHLFIL